MRTHHCPPVALVLCLALLGRGGAARAFSPRLEPFAQELGEVYREIKATGESRRHAPPERVLPRARDILKTSDRVFAASPEASAKLKHLRAFARGDDAGGDEPPARDLLAVSDPGLAALVGISVYWHEAQHRYDRAAPYRAGLRGAAMELPMPLEMERRGWEAGCAFWKAGIAALVKPGASDWPRSYYCEEKFPAAYYCRLYFSVEIVVLTAHELEAQGRPRAQALASSSRASPFEAVLHAYCGEYERAAKGNALDGANFVPSWSAADCLDRALEAVLDPSWRGSGDLCGEEHPPGADIRGQARALRDWK